MNENCRFSRYMIMKLPLLYTSHRRSSSSSSSGITQPSPWYEAIPGLYYPKPGYHGEHGGAEARFDGGFLRPS